MEISPGPIGLDFGISPERVARRTSRSNAFFLSPSLSLSFLIVKRLTLLFPVRLRAEEEDALGNSFRGSYTSMMERTRENECTCFEGDTPGILMILRARYSLRAIRPRINYVRLTSRCRHAITVATVADNFDER